MRLPFLRSLGALSFLALALPATGGQNQWTALGPAGAEVYAVAVSPANRDLLVAGLFSGYATSADRGTSWNVTSAPFTTNGIAFDPTSPGRILAATSGGVGVSTDGGGTWNVTLSKTANVVVFDPKDPNLAYAGARFGFYRSTDRGATWVESSNGLGSSAYVLSLAVHPVKNNVIYAGLWNGIFRSTDGGANWAAAGSPSGRVTGIAVDPVNPDLVVAPSGTTSAARSTDGGAHWTTAPGNLFPQAIVADRVVPGTFYLGGDTGFYVSQDGGLTWSALAAGLTDSFVWALAVDPSERTRLYAGTHAGGVFALDLSTGGAPSITVTSPNGGEVWQAGSVHPVTWTSTGTIARVKVEFSPGGNWGSVFSTVAADLPNSGSYSWTVPSVYSANCYVRVSDAAGTCSDMSDAAFRVSTCPGVSIFPWDASYGASGGSGSITVAVMPGYPWTAASDVPWATVTSGSSGTGSGTVAYAVAANAGPARTGTLSIGGNAFALSQSAGSPGSESAVIVPIVLDVRGAGGSHFTSELTLTNRGGADASVRLAYTGAEDLGGGSGSVTLSLPARRQRILGDALADLAAMGAAIPGSGNRGGTLVVGFSGLASPTDGAVTVRTTTPVANGRAGLAYAGVPAAKQLRGSALICGLRETASDRSNVALQNAGSAPDGDVTLRVTVRSGDSDASATLPDVTLSPGGFKQIGAILSAAGAANGWVRVERVAGTAPYTAYGVVNDNANSDGSFVPAQAEGASSPAGLTIPVVVDTGVYTSELVLTNSAAVPLDVTLTLVAEAVSTTDRSTSMSVRVEAGRQVILPNVVAAFRASGAAGVGLAPGTVGALFVTVPGRTCQGLAAGVRTSAPGGGGRYGLFYTAVPRGEASTSGAWLYALRQDAENRTNVALVNTGEAGGADDVFTVDLYDGDSGQLSHTESGVVLGSRRWQQFGSALSTWAPWVSQGYAHVRRISGVNPFVAYAVVNDGGVPQQRSDDGAFVASAE
jgi:hypothetical protein